MQKLQETYNKHQCILYSDLKQVDRSPYLHLKNFFNNVKTSGSNSTYGSYPEEPGC